MYVVFKLYCEYLKTEIFYRYILHLLQFTRHKKGVPKPELLFYFKVDENYYFSITSFSVRVTEVFCKTTL